MTKVTNTHDSVAVSIADGSTIGPGQTVDLENWAETKKDKRVQSYLDQGILVVGASKAEQEDAALSAVTSPAPVRK